MSKSPFAELQAQNIIQPLHLTLQPPHLTLQPPHLTCDKTKTYFPRVCLHQTTKDIYEKIIQDTVAYKENPDKKIYSFLIRLRDLLRKWADRIYEGNFEQNCHSHSICAEIKRLPESLKEPILFDFLVACAQEEVLLYNSDMLREIFSQLKNETDIDVGALFNKVKEGEKIYRLSAQSLEKLAACMPAVAS